MTLTRLGEELQKLSQHGSDGILILANNNVVWNLHLTRGKLLYPTGGVHPVRRWNRALKQHCSNWNWRVESSQLSEDQPWECQLLVQGINQKQLSAIQAKLVIRTIVQECFFELSSYTNFTSDWRPGKKDVWHISPMIALSSWEVMLVLSKATNIQQKWQAAGLSHLKPSLAPVLKSGVNPPALAGLQTYLNGQFTLWDIALAQEKSVIEITQFLIPWANKGTLQFQQVQDLPAPTLKQKVKAKNPQLEIPLPPPSNIRPNASTHQPPLIACIDDSPVLTHSIKKILMPAGYQVLSIPEPMRGFFELIEHKPDLILLDLLLPNADGYSVCKFLRDTPAFKTTPIIILTGRNTPIDRARARLVGASEFLGKPPEPQELIQMIRQHLGQ